jgi:hypothetical protein
MADLCLVFEEASILFSKVVVSPFPTSFSTFVVGCVLDNSYSKMSEVES